MSEIYSFCRSLPKSELHAHLGGSVSASTLRSLILSSRISSTEELILRINSSLTESEVRSRQILNELSSVNGQQITTQPVQMGAKPSNTLLNGTSFIFFL